MNQKFFENCKNQGNSHMFLQPTRSECTWRNQIGTQIYLSVRPSVRPSVCPSVRPSVRPSIRPSVHPSVRPSVLPSFRPSVLPSFRPSVHPSIRPSVHPSIHPSVNLSIRPFIHLSVHACRLGIERKMAQAQQIRSIILQKRVNTVNNIKLTIIAKIRETRICSSSPQSASVFRHKVMTFKKSSLLT
jgi:hypothetical protein